MRDELRQRALLEVKGYLLLEAIAEKEKLEASEEDLEKHFEKLSASWASRRRRSSPRCAGRIHWRA